MADDEITTRQWPAGSGGYSCTPRSDARNQPVQPTRTHASAGSLVTSARALYKSPPPSPCVPPLDLRAQAGCRQAGLGSQVVARLRGWDPKCASHQQPITVHPPRPTHVLARPPISCAALRPTGGGHRPRGRHRGDGGRHTGGSAGRAQEGRREESAHPQADARDRRAARMRPCCCRVALLAAAGGGGGEGRCSRRCSGQIRRRAG